MFNDVFSMIICSLFIKGRDPKVGSTSEADLHTTGTAASPMSVRTVKKPWLLRFYTRKRLLGCFIFQVTDGVALAIILIAIQAADGLIIAVSPMQIMSGVLGIISYCLQERSKPQIAVLLISGIFNRLVKVLILAFTIKLLYQSIILQIYRRVAGVLVYLIYVLIVIAIDLTGICQAVRYTKALQHQSLRRIEQLTDIMTFMAKKNAWILQGGTLVPINPNDEDHQNIIDQECTSNYTAPEA